MTPKVLPLQLEKRLGRRDEFSIRSHSLGHLIVISAEVAVFPEFARL